MARQTDYSKLRVALFNIVEHPLLTKADMIAVAEKALDETAPPARRDKTKEDE